MSEVRSEPTAAEIQLSELTFSYPGTTTATLAQLQLDIPAGEITALVGPSGCGKTTLLKLVGGMLTPTQGDVKVNGRRQSQVPLKERRIGWVPQQYALFDHLDVKGNIAFGLRAQGLAKPRRRARVEEMLELCRITELADRPVGDLSGGQRQRVAIARALAPSPQVLLLDEPLAALDPQLRGQLREDLASMIKASGVTTIIVTHDQDEALAVSDYLVVMRSGEIVRHGAPAEVWQRPHLDWVAEFIGGATVVPIESREEGSAVAAGLRFRSRATDSATALALRSADLRAVAEPSEESIPTEVIHAEFNGDQYRLRVRTQTGIVLPAHSWESAAPGEQVHIEPSGSRLIPEVVQ